MLETQTPAYALTSETRRAIDDIYKQAKTLNAVTGMRHSVRAIIPHNNQHVSGLNVPNNLEIVLVENLPNPLFRTRHLFELRQKKAKKALRARNI
jgi:hypothetical protein